MKNELRKKYKSLRKTLSEEEKEKYSKKIYDKCISQFDLQNKSPSPAKSTRSLLGNDDFFVERKPFYLWEEMQFKQPNNKMTGEERKSASSSGIVSRIRGGPPATGKLDILDVIEEDRDEDNELPLITFDTLRKKDLSKEELEVIERV